MCRTRKLDVRVKPRHINAIPYKRQEKHKINFLESYN